MYDPKKIKYAIFAALAFWLVITAHAFYEYDPATARLVSVFTLLLFVVQALWGLWRKS